MSLTSSRSSILRGLIFQGLIFRSLIIRSMILAAAIATPLLLPLPSYASSAWRPCPSPLDLIPRAAVVPTIGCDLDGNGFCSCDDIDAMTVAIANGDGNDFFDLNDDGVVDLFDRESLIHDHFDTTYGDSNLDGIFDPSDFVQVFTTGFYNDESAEFVSYCDGDWNGDGVFDSSDLVLAFQDGGFVPEPGAGGLLVMGGLGAVLLRRRSVAPQSCTVAR